MSDLDRILAGLIVDPETRREMEAFLGIARPRARSTGARPSQPISVEREYAQILTAIAEVTGEAIQETLLEYVRSEVEGDALEIDALDPIRLSALIARLRELAARVAAIDVGEQIGRIAARIVSWNARDMAGVLGVPVDAFGSTVLASLDAWRAEQADLITSISTQQVERVADIIGEAQATGERVESVATRIQAELGIARRRAETIATDQVLTANARVTQERHREAGITRYEWSTSSDDRVRPEHERLDGQIFSWSGPGAPGAGIRGEPAHPGEAIRCRCVAIPVVD